MQTLSDVPRDRWNRPLITPVGGGKPEPYTRCTTYVGALEDTYNLEKWKMRMTAVGLGQRPDLMLAVQACDPTRDKEALNQHCDAAVEAAKASAAATMGTAVHKLTEAVDRGEMQLDDVPAVARPDVAAYLGVMQQAKLQVLGIERFVVLDSHKIGGTYDRDVSLHGRGYIADIKTGTLDFGMGKIAMQLAVYAHSRAYNVDTFERTDLDVDLERAIVIHLPIGTGKCFLRWVDIASGWEAVQLAGQVREWRKRKNLSEVFEYARVDAEPTPAEAAVLNLIASAQDVRTLNGLWHEYNPKGLWTAAHTEASKARKAQLTNTN